jgi:hypothetical protein
MARSKLTLDALISAKEVAEPEAQEAAGEAAPLKKRGRPVKRNSGPTYNTTLRLTHSQRDALQRAALAATRRDKRISNMQDVVLEALERHLLVEFGITFKK